MGLLGTPPRRLANPCGRILGLHLGLVKKVRRFSVFSWREIGRMETPKAQRMHVCSIYIYMYMDVSENSGTPKSSIFIGFSIINHPFWGTPIFGNTHMYIYIYIYEFTYISVDSYPSNITKSIFQLVGFSGAKCKMNSSKT